MKFNDYQLKEKAAALAKHLGISADDVSEQICDTYGMTTFNCDGGEYAIATDGEADKAAQAAISDSLWAFNAEFILSECGLPSELADGLKAAQEKQCEDANDWLLPLVEKQCGLPDFVSAACSADGRGHFLSSYDGEENEQDGFYIYRTN